MIPLSRYLFRYLLAVVILLLVAGTLFYHFYEHWSWVNAYYFCVVTLATVGYGDLTPHTDLGKIFTTFYIMSGVGVITTFLGAMVRRRADKVSRRRTGPPGNPED